MNDDWIVKLYKQRRPTSETNRAIVAEISTRTGRTALQIRNLLNKRGVYVSGSHSDSKETEIRDRQVRKWRKEEQASRIAIMEQEKEERMASVLKQTSRYESSFQSRKSPFPSFFSDEEKPFIPIQIMILVFLVALTIAAIKSVF